MTSSRRLFSTSQWFLICIPVFTLTLQSCGPSKKIAAPTTTMTPGAAAPSSASDALPALPPSEIDLPIKIAGRPLIATADSLTPKEFLSDGWPGYLQTSCDFRYKYRFIRSGFTVQCTNNRLSIALRGHYQVAGGRCLCVSGKPVSPWVSGYCGFDNEPMRRVDLSFSTQLNFQPDYRLHTASGLDQLSALDRCTMSVFSIDMTQQIMDSIGASVNAFCKTLDASIAKMNFSGTLHQSATKAGQKIAIGPYGYLVVNPTAMRIGNLNYARDTFNISMGITCAPQLGSDSTNPARLPPLPPLQSSANRSGVTLYLPASYDYSFINRLLNDSFRNRSFEYQGQKVTLRQLTVSGFGHHQIKMTVDFGGSHEGQFSVWGTPTLDTVRQELRVPDIQYELKSKEFAIKLARILFKNKIREGVKGNSFLDLAALLRANLPTLNAQLNRAIAPGIFTTGEVKQLKMIGLQAGEKSIQVQVYLRADLAITCSRLPR
ncbi:MAG: DUF4403 family protein [Bacteroidetes bacterium]|nr:DUF4403 family protein [Bacteroidota bacterium]